MHQHDWIEEFPAAVTVIDADGVIVAMNARSRATFAKNGETLLGRSVFDCHPEAAQQQIRELLASGATNHYTITKAGQKKIIHQMPWFQDGRVAGMVEISVPIPNDMAHHDRG